MGKTNAEKLQEALDNADDARAKQTIAGAYALGDPSTLSADVRAKAEQILNED